MSVQEETATSTVASDAPRVLTTSLTPRFTPTHRWKVLGVGFAANASFAAAFSGLPTTAVLMRADYHLQITDLGMILGAMGLGVALSELPWGLLTDKLGDRRVLLSGLGLTGVLLALMAVFVSPSPGHIPSPLMLGASLVLVGLIGGSVNGSSGRAIMAWFREGERGLAMSIRQVALPGGGAIGAVILPSLAAVAGFRAVYGVLAALCLITTAFVWLWLHEPGAAAGGSPRQPIAPVPSAIGPLRNAQVWRTVLGLGALCIPQIAVLTFAAVFLHDVGHLSVMEISAGIVTVQIGAAIGRVWSGHFTDRKKNRRSFMKGCAIMTAAIYAVLGLFVAMAAHAPVHSEVFLPLAVVTLVIGGIVASCWNGIAFTELATVAGMSHVGTALGLGNTFAFGAYFVTPLAIPAVLAWLGWVGVWLVAAGCAGLAFLLFPPSPKEGRSA
ncbi:MFS transporter [Bradyrhizobium sp. U87765 SZCCT0131]|uniref:MFS transporter n=1 Tax=unclassified Bradyrhizobium TaxID=2631580 RepID=UPI001BAADCA8|nr:MULTISPECIES: MFS transporter [unclassified Bradyrhizobium]MBR1219890.1 MFS transporter [Bradyrhizobium sp. U87765 SZCCT0131]MBR1260480.1 MFS transporter [Bradyrhizobium sp. U87765 SZCCT0134]MBR1309223.1 MFS transporter [Bradyrhizobium sp. U87765 SZCCT0110]MBR1323986.1 MFS transporter [Bradyrhizobium sp. U87765 SZCCT0109]MBR1349538.1 MFS transporter [Bradyrhizobium sp. U87765 SZCCT0048]